MSSSWHLFSRASAAILTVFCLSTTLFAQKETFSGYYIGSNGDTVQGTFPDYRQWAKNPDKVNFIPLTSGEPVVLTPATCSLLHITGYDSYVAYTGTRLLNPAAINSYSFMGVSEPGGGYKDSKDTTGHIMTFLRVIFDNGTYRLLAMNDKLRSNFYIQQTGKPAEELKYKMYFEKSQVMEESVFRQQLFSIFSNGTVTSGLAGLVEKLSYNEKSLTGFMEKITGVHKTTTKKKEVHGKTGFVITGGLSMNSLSVKSDNTLEREAGIKFNSSGSPVIGLGYMLRSKRNFGRVFLFPQLLFYRFKNEGEMESEFTHTTVTYQSDLVTNLSVQLGIDLLRTRHFSWYLAPGGSFLYMNGNRKTVNSKYIISTLNQSKTYDGFTFSPGVNLQTGIFLDNKWSFWASYGTPAITLQLNGFESSHKALKAGIGYRLKK